jgi:hypothetical protein
MPRKAFSCKNYLWISVLFQNSDNLTIYIWIHKKKEATREQLRQEIKDWYNGYHFGKDVTAVYNPFSFMNALRGYEFEIFWFQSGTPTFLIEMLKNNFSPTDLENIYVSRDFLGIFDVGEYSSHCIDVSSRVFND